VVPRDFRRRAAAALLLCGVFGIPFSSAAGSSLGTPASTQHAMGSHERELGLPNFGQVTPNLFRGAQPERDGYRTLQAMGFNVVVDMWGGNRSEQSAVEKLGMQYVSIPWHPHSPSDEVLARFLKVIEENPDKKVFVHCHAGIDRTGMAIASYRMAKEGWSADEAMKEMQLFGFNGFHRLRLPTLVRFEKDFPEHLKTSSAFQGLQVVKR
jgi:tyrosine-protein phosphatase SIW14